MKKKLLLLIEDNPLLTGMYKTALEKADFEVILAHDGQTGLNLAKDKKPEILVLDLLMPGMDGFAVLEKIKLDDTMKAMKIIILTSVTKKEDLDRAKALGANDLLIKSELTIGSIIERIKASLLVS